MKKVILAIVLVAITLYAAWFAASWIDIVADNDSANPQHSEYNLFVLMAND